MYLPHKHFEVISLSKKKQMVDDSECLFREQFKQIQNYEILKVQKQAEVRQGTNKISDVVAMAIQKPGNQAVNKLCVWILCSAVFLRAIALPLHQVIQLTLHVGRV